MSNILPKKSWHVYNDKNREKVRKDEFSARVEKERSDERASSATREHRLSILRNKAGLTEVANAEGKPSNASEPPKRFSLFEPDGGSECPIKGEFEKDFDSRKQTSGDVRRRTYTKNSTKDDSRVEFRHEKDDPIMNLNQSISRKRKTNTPSKDYSFV